MSADNLARQADGQTQQIALANTYIEQLQRGDSEGAQATLASINRLHGVDACGDTDSELFQQVGKLTRELHDSMNSFMQDSDMLNLMQEDMPDARQRLNHVIEITEQSAHDTMASIEHSTPLLTVLQQRAGELQQQLQNWCSAQQQQADVDDLGYLSDELDAFLQRVADDSRKVAGDLNTIMMAQGYQDLSGQIIQRVITLVQQVEENLVALLQLGAQATQQHPHKSAPTQTEGDRIGHGPAVPGVSTGERCNSQDEVDDLLSTLGF